MDSPDSLSADVRTTLAAGADAHSLQTDHAMYVRPMLPSDVPWIVNSWLKNSRKCPIGKRVRNEIWYDAQHHILEKLIPRARPLVACHPEDPTVCFGWICGEVFQGAGQNKPVLVIHYCYVKDRFKAHRRDGAMKSESGVGRLLLKTFLKGEEGRIGAVYTSYHTPQGHGWLERMADEGVLPFRYTYDPFLLLSSLPRGWY